MKDSDRQLNTHFIRSQVPPAQTTDFWQSLIFRFNVWQLTTAERDVAIGLLMGLSNKEIARNRRTTERTVRAHARSIYAKSGQSGRQLLTAFFFKELLRVDMNVAA